MENKEGYNLNLNVGKIWRTPILRWILGIIILIIVFCFGFKLGKYSTIFSEGYYGTKENYYRNNMMYPGNYQPQTIPTR